MAFRWIRSIARGRPTRLLGDGMERKVIPSAKKDNVLSFNGNVVVVQQSDAALEDRRIEEPST